MGSVRNFMMVYGWILNIRVVFLQSYFVAKWVFGYGKYSQFYDGLGCDIKHQSNVFN